MKSLFLFAAFVQGFFLVHAQSHLESRYEHGRKAHPTAGEKDFPGQLQTPVSNLREIVLLPLNETDSTYDAYNHVWNYTHDAVHQYYNSNCKDSLVTYYVNGILSGRDLFEWDSTGIYLTYTLNQTWDGANWINTTEDQSPVQFGCYIDYDIFREWNGNSWDTLSGIKEVLSFDGYGRISQRHYTRYVNSQWATYRNVYPHYSGVSDTITGIDEYRFNTANGQLISAFRDTNYVWLAFSSFCNNTSSEYLHQTYDIPTQTWNNASKHQYNGTQTVGTDTFYYFLSLDWNGASYDSASRQYIKHDYRGNVVEELDEYYDLSTHTWYTSYASLYNYTYGPGNEILRKEYIAFDCAPNFDSLIPCYVNLYSNFVSCGVTGVAEINAGKDDIRIFPSPTQSQLTISSSAPLTNATILVYDVQGKKMNVRITIQNTTAQLYTEKLPDGFYTLQIINNKTGERAAGKFVKQ